MTAGVGSPVFDYTSLDFSSMEQDLLRYAISRFPDEKWTDLNESNEGRRIIELLSYLADKLSYASNAYTGEAIISSLVREQNFRNIAKSFDYEPPGPSPSKVQTLRFTISALALPLIMPTSIQVGDSTQSLIFQPDASGTAVATTYDVSATQGRQITSEAVGTSDGSPDQVYVLAESPLLDGTLVVNVGGTPYTRTINFTDAEPTDTVYKLEFTESGLCRIIFGDNIQGQIPPIGQAITATYKVGGGEDGNLPIGEITSIVSAPVGVQAVTNITAATGGGDKKTLNALKKSFALDIKANLRAVTLIDYSAAALDVSGVLDAYAIDGPPRAGGRAVILYIVPNGGGTLSLALANQIVSKIRRGGPSEDPIGMAGKRVSPLTAVYVYLQIYADAFVTTGFRASQIQQKVKDTFLARYALGNVDFSEDLSEQEAYNTVDPVEQKITGLSRVFLRKFTIIPNFGRYTSSPTTGNGTVEGIIAQPTALRREWNIKVITTIGATPEYAVSERVLGEITAISDFVLEDEQAGLIENEYVTDLLISNPWYLRPREQESNEVWLIAANTSTSVTISGNSIPSGVQSLFVICSPGDSYAIERFVSYGKIVRVQPSGPAASAQTVVNVASSVGFSADDYVLIREGSNSVVLQIASTTSTSITFTTNLTFSITTAATLDWFWYNTDRTVGFAVINDSTLFVSGDEFYVDTYPQSGDLKLRAENYPILEEANLTVNPIGGVK